MFIKNIDDTVKFKQLLKDENPSIIVYCFYKNTLSNALYVGKTECKNKFNYVMKHHRISNIRSKFNDGTYLHIWFPKDMIKNVFDFEKEMIILFNPPMNTHHTRCRMRKTRIIDEWNWNDYDNRFSHKYETKCPYTDHMIHRYTPKVHVRIVCECGDKYFFPQRKRHLEFNLHKVIGYCIYNTNGLGSDK